MSVKLAEIEMTKRVIRMQVDALAVKRASAKDIKHFYGTLELIRDNISEALDRADDKRA